MSDLTATTARIAAPAVDRAARLLDLLADSASPLTLTQLSQSLELPKSSLHGLCATLETLNLIQRDEGGRYHLGPRATRWAAAYLDQLDLAQAFHIAWADLPQRPDDTVTFTLLDGADVVYIACRNGSQPLGLQFRAGMRLPAVYTATGHAMLSTWPVEAVEALLRDRPWPVSPTGRGPANLAELHVALAETRARGYSVDACAVRESMYCFGAPVFDATHDRAVGGVAISVLAPMVSEESQAAAGALIGKLAMDLNDRLGGRCRILQQPQA